MFTICFAVYASLVAVEPTEYHCGQVSLTQANEMVALCKEADKDPIKTCEARKAGALKWFITVKHISLETKQAPARLPAGHGRVST
ncbi:hypothetical protein [Acidithiobacillus sp.]|uniref:hypothetical protein n=1 Tax=Acidithiobacillus sp. TaxID=1872118 RepID=UPI00258B4BD0|nr:hypothetical protein [Acidithiobacillus sp.]MDD5374448.1 hypothetical protein [Acidithiobacillus sp.]